MSTMDAAWKAHLEQGDREIFSDGLTRAEILYFDDGTLAVKAGKTVFKVYRGILAAQSTVLRDMMSIPQPTNQELFDGVPVVEFHDNDRDLFYFFKAIFDLGSAVQIAGCQDFTVISALIRLSTKYDVQALREKAVARLTEGYPSTCSAWHTDGVRWERQEDIWEAIAALNLALEADIPSLLPLMLLDLSEYEVGPLLSGGKDYDGNHHALDSRTLHQLLCGKHNLLHKAQGCIWRFTTIGPSSSEFKECMVFEESTNGRLSWLESELEVLQRHPFSAFPSDYIKYVCTQCGEGDTKKFKDGKAKLWEMVPELFGLPPWGSVSVMDTT